MTSSTRFCPLCDAPVAPTRYLVEHRRYAECARCGLISMHPDDRAEPGAERARYETHRNDPDDEGYRAFLGRLADPLVRRLPPGARGLDFGSGPGPTLSVMLVEAGFPTEIYDPFFAPDRAVLEDRYDFVTCTEVVEHLFRPAEELARLDALVEPGGWLGIMTTVLQDGEDFGSWWYARDPTHVCFYRPRTLEWIGRWRGWSLERPHPNVALYRKPG